ncbi:universal stress protein [Roseospira goensis]|uniref:Nucleotide-binding universal stress UspA family protein n=1 Tax=Roseospira goensis TaxID=391922 RepID=A0A7W6S018_9PROT|nr:universal stress protein [Roseospira goensis]MBB4286226.1 nucleotide-binding universal stress UspA family protein [Roseospira goensis]
MYTHIMVPVDLAHADTLDKAMTQAADLGKLYEIPVTIVGVTLSQPTDVAHNPAEYKEKLAQFAAAHSARTGVTMEPHTVISHDPAVDLDDMLREHCHDLGADLVVMASHIPRFRDVIFGSHADAFVRHGDVSVFVVR